MTERVAQAISPDAFMPWAFEGQTDLAEADRAGPGYLMLVHSKAEAQRHARGQAMAAIQAMRDAISIYSFAPAIFAAMDEALK